MGVLRGRPAVPRVPAVGTDVRPHLAPDERHAGAGPTIPSPWPAEIRGLVFRVAGEGAVEKDVAVRVIRRRAGGGDVTAVLRDDRAVIEDGGGRPEDEIDAAFNVAVLVILPSAVRVERVLPPEEAAISKDLSVPGGGECEGLAVVAGGVF